MKILIKVNFWFQTLKTILTVAHYYHIGQVKYSHSYAAIKHERRFY